MYSEGNPKISIIQGDSHTREISFKGITIDLIDSIYFSCCGLSICKKLEKDLDNNLFILYFKSEETEDLPAGIYDYDLTIKFANKDKKTVQYKSIISILEKCNKVVCYE